MGDIYSKGAKTMIIYCLTNEVNDKKYIGQTINFKKRMNEHRVPSGKVCRLLSKAIKKYGWESFRAEIIDETAKSYDELNLLEIHYIKKHKSLATEWGYNLESGGNNKTHSLESKQICREKKQAWWDAHPEEKERMSKQHKGKTLSQESKELMIKNMPQRKEVMIEGIKYQSIREAARQIGISKQLCMYRLKAKNFPNWEVI